MVGYTCHGVTVGSARCVYTTYQRMPHIIRTRRAVSSPAIARIRMMGPKSRESSSVGVGSAVVVGSCVVEGGSVPSVCVDVKGCKNSDIKQKTVQYIHCQVHKFLTS